MRAKLEHVQQVLEVLTLKDYDKIGKQAREMSLLSQAATWQVLQTAEYRDRSMVFDAAWMPSPKRREKKNLEGAATGLQAREHDMRLLPQLSPQGENYQARAVTRWLSARRQPWADAILMLRQTRLESPAPSRGTPANLDDHPQGPSIRPSWLARGSSWPSCFSHSNGDDYLRQSLRRRALRRDGQ